MSSELFDHYFSQKMLEAHMSPRQGGPARYPCFVMIDGVEHRYTDAVRHGRAPLGKQDDLHFVGTAPLSAVRVGSSDEWPTPEARHD